MLCLIADGKPYVFTAVPGGEKVVLSSQEEGQLYQPHYRDTGRDELYILTIVILCCIQKLCDVVY
jgi:hypothetical protein